MSERYIPETPGETTLFELESTTFQGAINNLLRDAAHMPYGSWEGFCRRGYRILKFDKSENAFRILGITE
ncbi:MAG: hypothetical protein AAF478_13690 [Pseudomonadota bacterium]